jgi:hypothetical protein
LALGDPVSVRSSVATGTVPWAYWQFFARAKLALVEGVFMDAVFSDTHE